MSGRIAVELRRCAAGMAETQGWQLKLVELACTRIENAHKVRKKTSVFIYVAVICTTTGGGWGRNRDVYVWIVMISPPRNVARRCSLGEFYVCAGKFDIENLLKSPLIYSVSYFNFGAWGFVWRGEAHQSIPVATGLNPTELPISDKAWNDVHIASTGVKLH